MIVSTDGLAQLGVGIFSSDGQPQILFTYGSMPLLLMNTVLYITFVPFVNDCAICWNLSKFVNPTP